MEDKYPDGRAEFCLKTVVDGLHEKYGTIDINSVKEDVFIASEGYANTSFDTVEQIISSFINEYKIARNVAFGDDIKARNAVNIALEAAAYKLAKKVILTFSDNEQPHDSINALNNVFSTINNLGFANNLMYMDIISDLITAERAPFKAIDKKQHIALVPYLVNEVFPQIRSMRDLEQKQKSLDNLLEISWNLIHDESNMRRIGEDLRILHKPEKVHAETLSLLKDYLAANNFLVSNERITRETILPENNSNIGINLQLMHNPIRYITGYIQSKNTAEQENPFKGAYLKYTGVADSKSRNKTLKIMNVAGSPHLEISLNGVTPDEVIKLIELGKTHIQPHLKAGTPLYSETAKALSMLQDYHLPHGRK